MTWRVTTLVLAVSLLAGGPARAQWIKLPTPNAPRMANGELNVDAPAPRAADGKPDFSGIWDIEHNMGCPPATCYDLSPGREFVNLGWSIKSLPYQPWAAALAKKRTAELRKEDPYTYCQPVGPVRILTSPLMRKMIQVPGLVLILSERNNVYRQIFTDGRTLPADPEPSMTGYSVGRWDGDTLEVKTVGLRDGIWLDANGSPITEAAKITERYRRPTYGRLQIELTVDDPKAYTAPFTVTLNQFLQVDTELLEYQCQENERSTQHFVVAPSK